MGYVVLGSFTTIQVVSQSQVIDVLRINFSTTPSGITAYANAPYKSITGVQPGDVEGIADVFILPLADGIERMMGSGEVTGAVGAEDTDASELLVDYIDATVEYRSPDLRKFGPYQQVVRIPVQFFDEPSFYDALVGVKIDGAYQALKQLAGD